MPAAGVHPVQRWLRELVAEFGWLPGDQRTVAAAGAADVDDGLVQLACHAVPGLGERVTVEAQPDYYGEILSLLQFSPLRAGSCPQAGQARGARALAAGSLMRAWLGCGSVASSPGGAADRGCYAFIRRECRASLSANCGCWHAPPMSVSAMRTLAPGCSRCRLRPAVSALRLPSRTAAEGPTCGAQVAAVMVGCEDWH